MAKYIGTWSANNGSTFPDYGTRYESNNKRKMAKRMKEIAQGNTYSGNKGYWAVWNSNHTINDRPILEGIVCK